MRKWRERTREEAELLAPPFCSLVISASVIGYSREEASGMPYVLPFLVLPIVLHKQTRDSLPRDARTSLAAWLDDNEQSRIMFCERARALAPFAREALLFGVVHGLMDLGEGGRLTTVLAENSVLAMRRKTSGEVRDCITRGQFTGRWFGAAGSAETVMALWGVRP